jgi:hypothetical protein
MSSELSDSVLNIFKLALQALLSLGKLLPDVFRNGGLNFSVAFLDHISKS